MEIRSKGGNVKKADAAARVEIAKKSAFIAVEVPKAPSSPTAMLAPNMDTALDQLGVSFKVQLRRLDGSVSKEKIKIGRLEDFDEATIVENSETLSQQRLRMDFLHHFQNELKCNKVFREEMKEFLSSEKKQDLIQFLLNWAEQLKKPSSQFVQLLRS
jgi:hypothetical protein